MNPYLLILLVLTGIMPIIHAVPHKYYLITKTMTWSNAQTLCRTNYTDLAKIDSYEDMIRLQAEAQAHTFTSAAWIGLYNDINSWRWSYQAQPLGTYQPWLYGVPQNSGGHAECSAVSSWWSWFDTPCKNVYPFLCFDNKFSGSARFIYYSTGKNWTDAQNFCRQYHTDFPSAVNSTEDGQIKSKTTGWTWFGLFRESWKWSDQTKAVNITWASGKPDNVAGNSNCGYISNSLVTDAQCSALKPFYCHHVIMEQKIIRMKFQTDQDVNDPAVRAAMQEMIYQKLEAQGLYNMTVRFREQPDGQVFHEL